MKKTLSAGCFLLVISCSAPKPPDIPSLNPEEAASLLRYDNKAQNWLTYVRKSNTGCDYRLDLPDQSSHPTEISLTHIVVCGGRPSPLEFDASVVFEYDKAQGKWVIQRFSS